MKKIRNRPPFDRVIDPTSFRPPKKKPSSTGWYYKYDGPSMTTRHSLPGARTGLCFQPRTRQLWLRLNDWARSSHDRIQLIRTRGGDPLPPCQRAEPSRRICCVTVMSITREILPPVSVDLGPAGSGYIPSADCALRVWWVALLRLTPDF